MNTYQHYCTQKHLAGKTEFEYPASKEINDLYYKFMESEWEDLENLTIDEIKALSQLFCSINELKVYILDPNFSKEVLKKMGCKFYFDKTKCLAQCTTDDERKAVLQEISKIEQEDVQEEVNLCKYDEELIEEIDENPCYESDENPYYESDDIY